MGPSGAGTPNSLITWDLFFAFIDPSKRIALKPACFKGPSSRSSIVRNWEKTIDLEDGFSSREAAKSFRSASTLDDGLDDEPSAEGFGGALKRSDSVSG